MNSLNKFKLALLSSLALCFAPMQTHAQSTDAKRALAKSVIALQQGAELERLINQLAGGAVQSSMQKWGMQIEASVPKGRQKEVSSKLNPELEKFNTDLKKIIHNKVPKVSDETLVVAYSDKFSEEELTQLKNFYESPVAKKYQTMAPELGQLFVKKLVDSTQNEVLARAKAFDNTASKITGVK